MSNIILFVFEGKRIESHIYKAFEDIMINENTLIKCVYGTVVYSLYDKIIVDDNFDTLTLLKEFAEVTDELQEVDVDDVSDIFFFFDYDGHASNSSDEKLKELLNVFNDSLGIGKLYISYPMAESLKHYQDDEYVFKDLKICKSDFVKYKSVVSGQTNYKHVLKYNRYNWSTLINIHLCKANFIVNGVFEPLNETRISQIKLFDSQLLNYLSIDDTVGVVSSIPLFLLDFYKYEVFVSKFK